MHQNLGSSKDLISMGRLFKRRLTQVAVKEIIGPPELFLSVVYLKKKSTFPVDDICFKEIVHDKLCLDKSVEQIINGLELGFAKPWLISY